MNEWLKELAILVAIVGYFVGGFYLIHRFCEWFNPKWARWWKKMLEEDEDV